MMEEVSNLGYLHNEVVCYLYRSHIIGPILRIAKATWLGWAGHIAMLGRQGEKI